MKRTFNGYNIAEVQDNLGWSFRIFAKLLMAGGLDTPDVSSKNVFASSFKIAAACFKIIVLSTEFETG